MRSLILVALLASQGYCETCQVKAPNGGGVFSMGEGVYIGDGIVLTAKHVIRGATGFPTVHFKETGKSVKSTDWAQSKLYDLAGLIVEAPEESEPTLLSGQWPETAVYTPRGSGAAFRGRFNQHRREMLSWPFGQVQGDSGGPVVNGDGEVVSIIALTDGKESHGPHPEELVYFVERWRGQVNERAYDPVPPAPKMARDPQSHPSAVPGLGKKRAQNRPLATKGSGSDSSRDSAQSLDELAAAIVAKLAADGRFVGANGDRGSVGPRGEPGKHGLTGKDGIPGRDGVDCDSTKVLSLEAQLLDLLGRVEQLESGKFEVEVISPRGEQLSGQVSAHGGLLYLDLSN